MSGSVQALDSVRGLLSLLNMSGGGAASELVPTSSPVVALVEPLI
jgi:hypothetical protein